MVSCTQKHRVWALCTDMYTSMYFDIERMYWYIQTWARYINVRQALGLQEWNRRLGMSNFSQRDNTWHAWCPWKALTSFPHSRRWSRLRPQHGFARYGWALRLSCTGPLTGLYRVCTSMYQYILLHTTIYFYHDTSLYHFILVCTTHKTLKSHTLRYPTSSCTYFSLALLTYTTLFRLVLTLPYYGIG